MLRKADVGILFNPPKNVLDENIDLTVARSYEELESYLNGFLK